jgi:HEAT repeat protein
MRSFSKLALCAISMSLLLSSFTVGAQSLALGVQQFYRSLADSSKAMHRTEGDSVKYAEQTQQLSDGDIERLMPTLLELIRLNDHQLRSDSLLALFTIGQRHNGAELLSTHIEEIGALLSVDDPTLPGATATFMSSIKPVPPREVIRPLYRFLKMTNADPQAQVGAVYTLVRLAPDDNGVAAAVASFFGRSLVKGTREDALNALGSSKVTSTALRSIVYQALSDQDPGVRFTAVQTLSRMGPEAVMNGRPLLEKLSNSPTESEDLRNAASEALRSAGK